MSVFRPKVEVVLIAVMLPLPRGELIALARYCTANEYNGSNEKAAPDGGTTSEVRL